jgi:hypothetical protein
MSIDSNNDCEEEGEGQQLYHNHQHQQQTATTPLAKVSSGGSGGVGGRYGGGGAHVSIVTPDGQPFRLLTTPVHSRKIQIDSSIIDINSSAFSNSSSANDNNDGITDELSSVMLQPRRQHQHQYPSEQSMATPILLSTEMEVSNGPHGIEPENDVLTHEGDQANALLSRRLNRYQVQRQSS